MIVLKHIGRDCELSTTGIGPDGRALDSGDVTDAVLRHIAPAGRDLRVAVWSPAMLNKVNGVGVGWSEERSRHWTGSGMCVYQDLAHVEVCTAATLSPRTFAAQSIAALRLVERARQLAEQDSAVGNRYYLSASNADLLDPSISFGTHVSLSVAQSLWEDLFIDQRRPAMLGFLASIMAAAIPFFGCGYLLPLQNGTVIFSQSARAHHITRVQTLATTTKWQRGLLNSRREAHCTDHERLHLIGFDYSILAAALLASFLQCALAAAEIGFCKFNLVDPLRAMHDWSWNLDPRTGKLPAVSTLSDGRQVTLPQFMREITSALLEAYDNGTIDHSAAPEAGEYLSRIIDLTHYAEEGLLIRCAQHLDWAAKLVYLLNLGGRFEDAAWRIADHDFANTNPQSGVLWDLWRRGLVDPLVAEEDVGQFLRNPPSESRDWGRGRLIEAFTQHVSAVDWSYVELKPGDDAYHPRLRVDFPRLDSWNRPAFEPLLNDAPDLESLRKALHKHERLVWFNDDRLPPASEALGCGADSSPIT